MAFGAVMPGATLVAARWCMTSDAAIEASDHHLLVIASGCLSGRGSNELRPIPLLKGKRSLVTNAALDVAVGAMVKARVPQPHRRHIRRQNVEDFAVRFAG